ncbi:MAG: hypothetical protein U0Y08_13890 [Bacteroidia bacterium]
MKKFIYPGIFAVLASMLMFSSCYYDNAEELNPNFGQNGNCDTAGVISYSGRIAPLMTAYCGSTGSSASSCHGNGSSSGIPLVTWQQVSDAASDNLMDAIRHENGASPMPKGGGKLDDCSILVIQKWIDEGKQNN